MIPFKRECPLPGLALQGVSGPKFSSGVTPPGNQLWHPPHPLASSAPQLPIVLASKGQCWNGPLIYFLPALYFIIGSVFPKSRYLRLKKKKVFKRMNKYYFLSRLTGFSWAACPPTSHSGWIVCSCCCCFFPLSFCPYFFPKRCLLCSRNGNHKAVHKHGHIKSLDQSSKLLTAMASRE